jgi:hypothetical protein
MKRAWHCWRYCVGFQVIIAVQFSCVPLKCVNPIPLVYVQRSACNISRHVHYFINTTNTSRIYTIVGVGAATTNSRERYFHIYNVFSFKVRPVVVVRVFMTQHRKSVITLTIWLASILRKLATITSGTSCILHNSRELTQWSCIQMLYFTYNCSEIYLKFRKL